MLQSTRDCASDIIYILGQHYLDLLEGVIRRVIELPRIDRYSP